jgi:hypothetical protein
MVDEVAQEQVLVIFCQSSSTIASDSSVITLLRCPIALTRQHIITSLVSKLEASHQTQQLADCKVRKLGFRFLSL